MTIHLHDPAILRTVIALAADHFVALADRHRVLIAAAIAQQSPNGFVFLDVGDGRFTVGRSDAPRGYRPVRRDGVEALFALHRLVAAEGVSMPWIAETQGGTAKRLQRAARGIGRVSPELGACLLAGVHVKSDGQMHFQQDTISMPIVIRVR